MRIDETQEGSHIEIGGRHRFKGVMEFAVTLFQIRIEDEIFFNEALQVNGNYDDKNLAAWR